MHSKRMQLKQEDLEIKTYLYKHKYCTGGQHKCKPSSVAGLRSQATESEVTLWGHLRDSQLGSEFIHQYQILGFVVDFYCPEKLIVVEVDGPYHEYRKRKDRMRDGILASYGIKTVRIKNELLETDLQNALARIKGMLLSR